MPNVFRIAIFIFFPGLFVGEVYHVVVNRILTFFPFS
jgi:hypothetical protein